MTTKMASGRLREHEVLSGDGISQCGRETVLPEEDDSSGNHSVVIPVIVLWMRGC